MQPNLKTLLVIAVMVVVALFAGLLYLSFGNKLFAVTFGGVVLVFGGYAEVYLFALADNDKKKGRTKVVGATPDEAADQTEDAAIAKLPKLLNNRAAIALLNGLRDAWFLDEQYQPMPNIPLCQKAYIAGCYTERLRTLILV